MVVVEAHNVVEASHLGRQEFAALIGAEVEGVGVVDIYTEPVTFKEVGDGEVDKGKL
jgi:CobQ-like glutamine amidotransferase family enzyme